MRAQKVQVKARLAGMDFQDAQGCISKLREETDELENAFKSSHGEIAEELGDLMFSAVNAARFADIDAEEALTAATEKFIGRFLRLENALEKPIAQYSQKELDEIWERIKHA
jgi:tetrapyrrole methylase family protein/MazG family protein